MKKAAQIWIAFGFSVFASMAGVASPVSGPGDTQFRNDLLLLNDSGITNIPVNTWPIALGDVAVALNGVEIESSSPSVRSAYDRVKDRARYELETNTVGVRLGVSGAYNPRTIRSFENTPRDEGEAQAALSWLGERFTVNLAATYVANPLDGDEFRPDGTYLGVALGNWMVTAGWQERWWGPGRDGSLILSTNARPAPGVGLQRISSVPIETKWLSWMGPWTFATFMNILDDERVVDDAWLFGMRGSFRPPRTGLEIGISRTAQWCGDGRPCDLKTFIRLLNGNDNRGANIDLEDEPGNQLAGIDVRWALPKQIPVALYMQWIAEDTRRTGAQLQLWTKLLGAEHWGSIGELSHRTHFEFTNSSSHKGALGEGSIVPNIAYEHSIYKTGYRYNGRSLGFAGDGDTLSYSIGSTLVQSAGHSWNISLRYMEINRVGEPNPLHTLTPTRQDFLDVQLSHDRMTRFGRFYAGLGFSSFDDKESSTSTEDVTGFLQWSSQ